jgi:hypothetical protein
VALDLLHTIASATRGVDKNEVGWPSSRWVKIDALAGRSRDLVGLGLGGETATLPRVGTIGLLPVRVDPARVDTQGSGRRREHLGSDRIGLTRTTEEPSPVNPGPQDRETIPHLETRVLGL